MDGPERAMADERDAQSSGDDAGGTAILYEIARWRLNEQLERVRSLDNKLAATFTPMLPRLLSSAPRWR